MLREAEPEGLPILAVSASEWDGKRWTRLDLAVDSGAVATVMPQLPGIALQSSEASRAGRCYTTADGGELPNLGEQTLQGCAEDGQPCRITAQVADVTMALLSVASVSEAGNTFHFGAKAGFIRHVASGRVTPLEKRGRLYYLSMWVEVPPPGAEEAAPFGRQ
jgi:hypothetical protein